ncbi:MAG: biotin transporter BioY [Tissierellia bacterium]|nr:biotin transporter BioY [Tissierellia bacterium]
MNTKKLSTIALIIAMLSIGAMISIPIGPVPISLQSAFVIIGGIIAGSRDSAIAQIVYLIAGLIGLPVFAGMQGGIHYLFSPTFGFLLGFIPAAWIVGWGYNEKKRKARILSLIFANLVIYFLGIIYFYYIKNIYSGSDIDLIRIFKMIVIPFIPGDIVKTLIAYNMGIRLEKILNKINLKLA